jgi:hypothetical protein
VEYDEAWPSVEDLTQDKWRNISAMNISKQHQIGLMFSDMSGQFRRLVALPVGGRQSSFLECDRRNVASGSAQRVGQSAVCDSGAIVPAMVVEQRYA